MNNLVKFTHKSDILTTQSTFFNMFEINQMDLGPVWFELISSLCK